MCIWVGAGYTCIQICACLYKYIPSKYVADFLQQAWPSPAQVAQNCNRTEIPKGTSPKYGDPGYSWQLGPSKLLGARSLWSTLGGHRQPLEAHVQAVLQTFYDNPHILYLYSYMEVVGSELPVPGGPGPRVLAIYGVAVLSTHPSDINASSRDDLTKPANKYT